MTKKAGRPRKDPEISIDANSKRFVIQHGNTIKWLSWEYAYVKSLALYGEIKNLGLGYEPIPPKPEDRGFIEGYEYHNYICNYAKRIWQDIGHVFDSTLCASLKGKEGKLVDADGQIFWVGVYGTYFLVHQKWSRKDSGLGKVVKERLFRNVKVISNG